LALHIEFYRAGLVCESAPHIGCGIRAKPVLRELEARKAVAGVWLSRCGNILAVRWNSASVEDLESFARITDPAERESLLDSLAAARGWYCAPELDRLSVEEASVIAERMVQRLMGSTAIATADAARLAKGIADACERVLTVEAPEGRDTRLRHAILQAGRAHLPPREFDSLQRVLAFRGYRP
jgi:hypothetical protein